MLGKWELDVLNEPHPPPTPLIRDSDSSSVSFPILSPPLFVFSSLLGSGRFLFHKLGAVGHKQIDTYFWSRGDVCGASAAQITGLRYPRCPALASALGLGPRTSFPGEPVTARPGYRGVREAQAVPSGLVRLVRRVLQNAFVPEMDPNV